MPIDYKKYHKDWKNISAEVKRRYRDKCGICQVPNRIVVFRDFRGNWFFDWEVKPRGNPCKKVRIVLTVHHLDFNVNNNGELNLIALCQRCHLALDMNYKRWKRSKSHRLDR